jgi:hypothetical protein
MATSVSAPTPASAAAEVAVVVVIMVVLIFVKLGVMDAEHLIKLRTGCLYLDQVEVVNDHRQ